jgi:hypothetical protein
MALPTLTPASNTSAIILPKAGTAGNVQAACPIGVYAAITAFQNGAAAQVAYTYKKLGGDVLDIELTEQNVYANYEESVLEYSYLINLHQAKNALGSALGAATASFDYQGEVAAGSGASLKYPKFRFDYAFRLGDTFSTEAVVGGTEPVYSASFDVVANQQNYNLQTIIKSQSDNSASLPFFGKVGDSRVKIRQVYYVSPRQMWRFFGYYGGMNVTGDMHTYGQYADDSSFQVIPPWQNKLQAIQYEDHLYTRTSHYSYEINDNNLKMYPTPDGASPNKFWFRFTVDSGPFEDDGGGESGINNMNTLPFENIPYENINSIGKQWIRRFCLALTKETLGQIRGKFGGVVPIPGETVTLNAAELLSQAKEEQNMLRDELKTQLDEMTYAKLAERDKGLIDNSATILERVPMKIFVG